MIYRIVWHHYVAGVAEELDHGDFPRRAEENVAMLHHRFRTAIQKFIKNYFHFNLAWKKFLGIQFALKMFI